MSGITPSSDWVMFVAMAKMTQHSLPRREHTAQRSKHHEDTNGGISGHTYFRQPTIRTFKRAGADKAEIMLEFSGIPFGIAVARNNSAKVIFGDYSCVHKTSDGGVSWQQAYSSSADQHPSGSSTPTNQNYR